MGYELNPNKISQESSSGYGSLQSRKKKEPDVANPNPFDKGTMDADQFDSVKKIWESDRGNIFGLNAKGLQRPALYYDRNVKGGMFSSDGAWTEEKPLNQYTKEQQKEIIGKRKKIAAYSLANNLYSQEDWDSHEIKDEQIARLWNENEDIATMKSSDENGVGSFFRYLKTMKDYGLSEPELKTIVNNKKKELGIVSNDKGKPATELVEPLQLPDPINDVSRKRQPQKQGSPSPIPTPLTLDEEVPLKQPKPKATFQEFANGKFEETLNSMLGGDNAFKPLSAKDTIYGANNPNFSLPTDTMKEGSKKSKDELANMKSISEKKEKDRLKLEKREREYQANTFSLDSVMNANIDVKYDPKKKTFDYNTDFDKTSNDLRSVATQTLDKMISDFAIKKKMDKDDAEQFRYKVKFEAGVEDYNLAKGSKGLADWILGDYYEYPQNIKDVVTDLSNKLEDIAILKSRKLLGKSETGVGEWLDTDEAFLSAARGISPTVLNKLGRIDALDLGIENFDFATGVKNLASIIPKLVNEGIGVSSSSDDASLLQLLSNPTKFFSKEYTDSEAMNALVGIYRNKYQFSDDEARQQIKAGIKDIQKSQDTWSAAGRNMINGTANLIGEVIGPYKYAAKGFDKLLEKGPWVAKYVERTNIGKMLDIPGFVERKNKFAKLITTSLEGKGLLGGALPSFESIYGFPLTNITRATVASYASQQFYHGADVDEAIASGQNMLGIEVSNQVFNLMGLRGYKFMNTVAKSLGKVKGIKTVEEMTMQYNKHLNAIHFLTSFPAQATYTALSNPDATEKEYATELLMNLFMTGNNILAHRSYNKQIKDYHNNRAILQKQMSNWKSESPLRTSETTKIEDLHANAEKYEKAGQEAFIGPVESIYNEETGKVEKQAEVLLEKKVGFHDFAREVAGKTDRRKKIVVKDFESVVREEFGEGNERILDLLFAKVGNTKIVATDMGESLSPGFYDQPTGQIGFNSKLDIANNKRTLARAVIHEGVHVLTADHYDNDPVFKGEVDNLLNELVSNTDFTTLLDELKASKSKTDQKAFKDIVYSMSDPKEMITLMFDPGMQEGRKAIDRIFNKSTEKEQPKTFIDKMWGLVGKLLNRDGKSTPEEVDAYTKRFRDIVEGYDYNAPKTTKTEEKPADDPYASINEQRLFMPELINRDKLNAYNEARKERGMFEQSPADITSEFRARYGYSPDPFALENYVEMSNRILHKEKMDNFDSMVELIVNTPDKNENNFLDKSDINLAKEVFSGIDMNDVYTKSQDKTVEQTKDIIKDKMFLRNPDLDPVAVNKIAAVISNQIKQKTVDDTLEIAIGYMGGFAKATVNVIPGNYYDSTKKVDRTMGQHHYDQAFITNFPKSFRSAGGTVKSYVSPYIDAFYTKLDVKNLKKIGGVDIDGERLTAMPEHLLQGDVPIDMISQGYYMMTRGSKNETIWKIPGLAKLAHPSRETEAFKFAREAEAFNFGRWIDSDAQWLGSKEGLFMGRKLGELSGKLDFDMLINKYIENKNVPYADLMKEPIKDLNTDHVDLIGKKLKQYYTNAKGETYLPTYKRTERIEEAVRIDRDINKMLNETVTDLLYWRTDAGGGGRTIKIENGELSHSKASNKYEPVASTNDPLFIDGEYMKNFIPDAVKEDGSWDIDVLKEEGYTLLPDGNLAKPVVFLSPKTIGNNPFLSKLFADHKIDGAGLSTKPRMYRAILDAMGKSDDPLLLKPKMASYDENGNMLIYKTAEYDYAPDEYSQQHHAEYLKFMNDVSSVISTLSFRSSSKGSNTFRTRLELLHHTDNNNARAVFDNSGDLVDVVVKDKDGEYKSDTDLYEAELGYIQENLAKNIIDPRMIIQMPITGPNAVTYIETSHPATEKGGALGVNQNLMFNSEFEAFKNGNGPEAFKAFNNWESNIVAHSKRKIQGVYDLRDLLEGNSLPEPISVTGRDTKEESTVTDNVKIDIGAKFPKDQLKADQATKMIGFGANGSSTKKYAEAFGDKANAGVYRTDDKVFISVNGKGREKQEYNLRRTILEVDRALRQGVSTFIADNEKTANSSHNKVGEGEIRKFLLGKGLEYREENGIGIYSKKKKELPLDTESTAVTGGDNFDQMAETYSDRQEKLLRAGEVILDIADNIRAKITKGNEEDEFQVPGMSNTEALKLIESVVDSEGRVIPQMLNKLFLVGNTFVNGMKFAKSGEKSALMYQIKDYFNDALLTRSKGAGLTLMPDLDSKASMHRMYEPMIKDLLEKGETEKATAMAEEFKELLETHLDENGQLRDDSNGLIVGSDVMKKLGVKPGDKVFMKLTPSDDLHALTAMVIVGVSTKEGALVANPEYLANVNGRDYDKDGMQILTQDDKFISADDFKTIWDHWSDPEIGLAQGKYKRDGDKFRKAEKQLKNGEYKPLGDKVEHQDPTMTPQYTNAYDRAQEQHTGVAKLITLRNKIANGNRNMEPIHEKDGSISYVVNATGGGKNPKEYNIKLNLKVNSDESGSNPLANTSNAINNKMVDKYDNMPFDPAKAIWDQMIHSVNGKGYATYTNKEKADIRKALNDEYTKISGYGITKIGKQSTDNLKDVQQAIYESNPSGSAVTSKVARMMADVNVKVSNNPEVNKYVFYNDIGKKLEETSLKLEKEYATYLDPVVASNIFDSYKGSKKNIGQHLQGLFNQYTKLYTYDGQSKEEQQRALNDDAFSYISYNDFNVFASKEPSWNDIAAGTALHDWFNNNSHKSPNMLDYKVHKNGSTIEYDGYSNWLVKGDNKVKLNDIFNEKGELQVDWIDRKVLNSKWLRDAVQRKVIVGDNAKAHLIGKTIANVAKFIADKQGVDAGELFTMLAYNSTGNVNNYIRAGGTEQAYAHQVSKWMFGEEGGNNPANMLKAMVEVGRELRYDPLQLMQGAKMMGVEPKAHSKSLLDHMSDLATQIGEEKYGKVDAIKKGGRLYMPELEYKVGGKGLNIRNPYQFKESINDMLGKAKADEALKDIPNITEWSKDDYARVFDKILAPELKTLIDKEGKDLGWKADKIGLVTAQYLKNFGPAGIEVMSKQIDKTTSTKLLKGTKYSSNSYEQKMIYATQMTFLADALRKHFGNSEGSRFSHQRIHGDRKPNALILDYTSPANMKNFSNDHVFSQVPMSTNGKTATFKAMETGQETVRSATFKVGELINEKLNTGVGHSTQSIPFIKYVAPRNSIEDVAKMSEANFMNHIDNEIFGADSRTETNPEIVSMLKDLDNNETLTDIINNVRVDSSFNGLSKEDTKIIHEGQGQESSEGDLSKIKDAITNDWIDREIATYNKTIEGTEDADFSLTREQVLPRAKEYQGSLQNMLRLKALAMETANVFNSFNGTIQNTINSLHGEIKAEHINEINSQSQGIQKMVDILASGDIKAILKQTRAIDWSNIDNHKIIEEVFYNPVKEGIGTYNNFYRDKANKWSGSETNPDNKYLLTPGAFPEIFRNMEGRDNYALLPFLSQRVLSDTQIRKTDTGKYESSVVNDHKDYIKKVLSRLDPELASNKELLNSKADELMKDLIEINQKRFNINSSIYGLGYSLGLKGFEKGLDVAHPDVVFQRGYELKKELLRQYESQLNRINESYDISMADYEKGDISFTIDGIDIDFGDFMIAAKPELAHDKTFFTHSISNLEQTMKNLQNQAIGSVENVFKTLYIQNHPERGRLEENLILGELGHISGNRVDYNQHYDKESFLKANIEPGTDSYVRYIGKDGNPVTIYGRILGTREITHEKVADLEGNDRIEKRNMLFIVGDKKNGNKINVINTDLIQDVVAGEVYGGWYSQASMLDKKTKEIYAKNTDKLLDDFQSSLSKKSEFAVTGRTESDEFVTTVDQRLRANDLNKAKTDFQDVMQFTEEAIEKSFPTRLKAGQRFMKNMVVADSYMGVRYIAEAFLGLGMGAVGIGGALGMGPLAVAIGTAGLGLMYHGGGGYAKRLTRLYISNSLGTLGWVGRNPNNPKFLIGNILAIGKGIDRGFNIGRQIKLGKDNESLSKARLIELSAGTKNNRAKELLEEQVYSGENLRNRTRKEVMTARKEAKRFGKIFDAISEQANEFRKHTEHANQHIEEFTNQMVKKYSDGKTKIEFIKDVPFINGKPMTHYQQQEVSLMALGNYFLSYKGKFQAMEETSMIRATKQGEGHLVEYFKSFANNEKMLAPENAIYMDHHTQNLVQKTIGNFQKTPYQRQGWVDLNETYSRFSLSAKLDQITGWNNRREFYKAIYTEIAKDSDFQEIKKYMQKGAGLSMQGYKINNPYREFMINTIIGGILTAASTMAVREVDELREMGEDWFGLQIVNYDAIKLLTAGGMLLMTDDGKSPNSNLKNLFWETGTNMGGFVGYGISVPTQELMIQTELAMYNYYLSDMPYSEKMKVKKHFEPFRQDMTEKGIGNLAPLPFVSPAIKAVQKTKKEMKEKNKGKSNIY